MNTFHWKTVMILASLFLLLGVGVSAWGYIDYNHYIALSGLGIVVTVCVIWWAWAMMVIRYMINYTQKTAYNLVDIKVGLREVRTLLKEYKTLKNAK